MFPHLTADIIEDSILHLSRDLLGVLLFDRSTQKNIIWATDDYMALGPGYQREDEILPELITGEHTLLVRPRTAKAVESQQTRVRDRAEVFTPSWICNEQNNLVDDAWFGRQNVFNCASDKAWVPSPEKIHFPETGERTWQHYVDANRLEISCGEAPYIVSRYDATTGEMIPLPNRIGLLDRKLRVVNENTVEEDEWITWAIRAVQSIYGFEFQGDSLLLARENVFITFLEYYNDRYHSLPGEDILNKVATIISWNLWQMDGLKLVSPYSCKPSVWEEFSFFGSTVHEVPCPGCQKNDNSKHSGIYCIIMDWRENQTFRYIDLMKGDKRI